MAFVAQNNGVSSFQQLHNTSHSNCLILSHPPALGAPWTPGHSDCRTLQGLHCSEESTIFFASRRRVSHSNFSREL